MLKFISFGSGSSGNCYYLHNGVYGILIDIGIGVRTLKKYFIEYGLSFSGVRYIFVTHDHADHVKAVGKISSDYNIPVYATARVHEGIRHNYCVRRKINPQNIRILEKNNALTLDAMTITPFHVPHDSFDNVGYKIESEGITFCLMTDAGHVTDEMKRYIGESDYLVIEANHDIEMLSGGTYPQYLKERVAGENGHLSNRDCGYALAENATPRLRHVWLCHLSQENNHPELARKTVAMILKQHGILAGVDFKLEILKRRTPSEMYVLDRE